MAVNNDLNPEKDLVYLQVTYATTIDLIGPYLITDHGLDAARKRLFRLCKLNIEGMNKILLAKIRDDINQLDFKLQAINEGLPLTSDQNGVPFLVRSVLSSSAEVVGHIRKEEERGEKAELHIAYSCSMPPKLLMSWHECFAPYEKAVDMLVWPCKQGWNGVDTQLSSYRAQASLLLKASEELKKLSQAVPDKVEWLDEHMSVRQVMVVLKVVANDANG